jgi:hypothetical protein
MSISLTPPPKKYLSNKILLEEIHLSKNSYCWFKQPEYHRYDIIISDRTLNEALELINRDSCIEEATANFTKREGREPQKTELIFRVMTSDHIPPEAMLGGATRRSAKKKKIAELEEGEQYEEDETDGGVPFPPFQHYKFNDSGSLVCVGKSHWLDGKFSTSHGQITNDLAKAYLLLTDRFGNKWNYRGYSYLDEMKGNAIIQLMTSGLKFNEAKSENPFAYLTQVSNNAFVRQLNGEKTQGNIKNELLEIHGHTSSFNYQDRDKE